MKDLFPAWIFRVLAPLAYRLRRRWRLWRGRPLHGATMIARDMGDRILLVRHTYGPEGWFLPGGGIAHGESPREAAIRELWEETGCRAEGVRELGELRETVTGSPHTAHIFSCLTRDAPEADRREIAEARFFPVHSLPVPMTAHTRARLSLRSSRA